MNYLLDTNIISELSKPAPDPNCVAWVASKRGFCHLSSITLSELRYGIERLPEGKRKSLAETKFRFLHNDYQDKVFDFDPPASFEWGRYARNWKRCLERIGGSSLI